jgi:hypothetical protein
MTTFPHTESGAASRGEWRRAAAILLLSVLALDVIFMPRILWDSDANPHISSARISEP